MKKIYQWNNVSISLNGREIKDVKGVYIIQTSKPTSAQRIAAERQLQTIKN